VEPYGLSNDDELRPDIDATLGPRRVLVDVTVRGGQYPGLQRAHCESVTSQKRLKVPGDGARLSGLLRPLLSRYLRILGKGCTALRQGRPRRPPAHAIDRRGSSVELPSPSRQDMLGLRWLACRFRLSGLFAWPLVSLVTSFPDLLLRPFVFLFCLFLLRSFS